MSNHLLAVTRGSISYCIFCSASESAASRKKPGWYCATISARPRPTFGTLLSLGERHAGYAPCYKLCCPRERSIFGPPSVLLVTDFRELKCKLDRTASSCERRSLVKTRSVNMSEKLLNVCASKGADQIYCLRKITLKFTFFEYKMFCTR